MFVNITSYPSNTWEKDLLAAAKEIAREGNILDVYVPPIPGHFNEKDIEPIVKEIVTPLIEKTFLIDAILVNIEPTLNYSVVKALKAAGFMVLINCTDYEESVNEEDVTTYKPVFSQFRLYQ